jgi:hypothetical protein
MADCGMPPDAQVFSTPDEAGIGHKSGKSRRFGRLSGGRGKNWRHRGPGPPGPGISRIVGIASTSVTHPISPRLVMAADMVKRPGVTMFPAKTQYKDSQRLIRTRPTGTRTVWRGIEPHGRIHSHQEATHRTAIIARSRAPACHRARDATIRRCDRERTTDRKPLPRSGACCSDPDAIDPRRQARRGYPGPGFANRPYGFRASAGRSAKKCR